MADTKSTYSDSLEIKPGDILFNHFRRGDLIASMFTPAFGIARDIDNRFFIRDQGGYIMSRDEFNRLLPRLLAFYERYTDEDIAGVNAMIDEEHERASASAPPPARAPEPGYIYVIKCDAFYKIGKARDYQKRIARFETIYPHDLTVIHVARVDDMASAERDLHELYSAKRARGEWFSLTDDDIQHIAALLPDVVEVRS